MQRIAIWLGVLAWANIAQAQGDLCARKIPQTPAEYAAQLACQEHRLWREPYINADGQLIKIGPMEAERDTLIDGSPAWRRVQHYWQNSVGLGDLFRGQTPPCYPDVALNDALTRTQIVDTPWSGAFISYLMRMAGFSDTQFHFTDGHIRYIKRAYAAEVKSHIGWGHTEANADPNAFAFRLRDPLTTPLQVGDLLCYVRESQHIFGVAGFRKWLKTHYNDEQSLKSHCDIVVDVTKTRAYSVGGNVVQAVTMRELALNARGALSEKYTLPTRSGSWPTAVWDADDMPICRVDSQTQDNMNQHDWVALLRYRP